MPALVEQALVLVAERAHALVTLDEEGHLGLGLSDLEAAVGHEAAIVVHQLGHMVPQLDGGRGKRLLGGKAPQSPHAARVDARCVAAAVILLDERGLVDLVGQF